MREYTKQPQSQSHTLDSNPRASKQAPISQILQTYRDRTFGKPAQRQGVDDEELLQAKSAQQDQVNTVSQRYSPEDDEELIQGKVDTAQREEIDEDELLQGKFKVVQREELDEDEILQEKFESISSAEQVPIQHEEKPNNTRLPDNLKSGIENLSGYSMDDVKVRYNSDKPAQLNALAYAQGTDIHVAPGQEIHLPHEAWHVVQQKQGRVQPTMQLQGINVNDNEGLEKEADSVGDKLKRVQTVSDLNDSTIAGSRPDIIQRTIKIGEKPYKTIDKILEILPPTIVRNNILFSVIGSLNHADVVYKTLDELIGIIQSEIEVVKSQDAYGIWRDDRFEVIANYSGKEYSFNMSYKHFADTYRKKNRSYGTQNTSSEEGNTIIVRPDSEIMNNMVFMIKEIKKQNQTTEPRPPVLSCAKEIIFDDIKYDVSVGSGHIYPKGGDSTINVSNEEYLGLVAFVAWYSDKENKVLRGDMLDKKEIIKNSHNKITAISDIKNVPEIVNQADIDHLFSFIETESNKMGLEIDKVELSFNLVEPLAQVVWKKSIDKVNGTRDYEKIAEKIKRLKTIKEKVSQLVQEKKPEVSKDFFSKTFLDEFNITKSEVNAMIKSLKTLIDSQSKEEDEEDYAFDFENMPCLL